MAAQKGNSKIAVEVKSFLGRSELEDLQKALGQYTMYLQVMKANALDRRLYLAIRELAFNEIFEEDVGKLLLESELVKLLIFNERTEEIVRWIP